MTVNYKEAILSMMVDDVAKRAAAIREYVMDKTNSYEDRLEVFMKTPDHLQYKESYVWSNPNFDDDDWHEYNWRHPGQEVDLTRIPERHTSSYKEDKDKIWDEEKIKAWYTGCMDAGIWSMCYDW